MVAAGMTPALSDAVARFHARCLEARGWGVNDCCVAAADVLMAGGWPDLMAAYGRDYRSASAWRRRVRRATGQDGLAGAVRHAALTAGARRLMAGEEPADMDLGIVAAGAPGVVLELPAFRLGEWWHGLTPDGALAAADAIEAYRLG